MEEKIQFISNKLCELVRNKLVEIPVSDIEQFCDVACAFGLNPQGGALSNDCDSQFIYID